MSAITRDVLGNYYDSYSTTAGCTSWVQCRGNYLFGGGYYLVSGSGGDTNYHSQIVTDGSAPPAGSVLVYNGSTGQHVSLCESPGYYTYSGTSTGMNGYSYTNAGSLLASDKVHYLNYIGGVPHEHACRQEYTGYPAGSGGGGGGSGGGGDPGGGGGSEEDKHHKEGADGQYSSQPPKGRWSDGYPEKKTVYSYFDYSTNSWTNGQDNKPT